MGLTSGELSVLALTPQSTIGLKGCTWDTVVWTPTVVSTGTRLDGSLLGQSQVDWAAAKFKDGTSLSAIVAWSDRNDLMVQFVASDPNEKLVQLPIESIPSYAAGAPHGIALSGPNVTAMSRGPLNLAVWNKFDPLESNSSNVVGLFVDADASPFGARFPVSHTIAGFQGEPAVAALPNGQFVAAWSGFSSIDEARDDRDIYLRILKPADLYANAEIRVNSTLPGDQTTPKVASFGPDRFIVLWNTGNATRISPAGSESVVVLNSGNDIAGRIFDNTGVPKTAEFEIVTDFLDNTDVSLVALGNSTFAVAWSNVIYGDDGKPTNVEMNVELFDASGKALSGYQLPIGVTGTMTSPASIDVLSDWRFAVSWAQGRDILTTVYDTRSVGKTIKGTAADNAAIGTGYADRIFGYAGNDWLVGLGGGDTLIGGPGADKIEGGLGNDTASYADADAGVTASLYSNGGYVGDAKGDVFTDIENLTGSKYDDILIGYYDSNILKGGAGNDRLYAVKATTSSTWGRATISPTADRGTTSSPISASAAASPWIS